MIDLKIKICGMKHNVAEIAALHPDYLGFIFYGNSPRNYNESEVIKLSKGIKKVGVFVDQSVTEIIELAHKFNFDIIQLHGNQTNKFVALLNLNLKKIEKEEVEIWKVFSIKNTFDFSVLESFENLVSKFLFDTKGKEKGGNGVTFDWSVLENYPSTTPFILSGGIGLAEISEVKKIQKSSLPIYGIDVNSKFELKPGLKDILALKKLIEELK
ncbi:N-(5'-phosphoribosyl)anthranilate isomerase [Patiriisocius marinistellae]|uniref:N-(5'-phosphoribosyl)anthranilate isomerase n=1 Tax=Patiriisocius marinistellae TaxID=2494560 RepID=A0A5J4G123_9FLAO|nr:phosphoribosylanthranilate isomerase [Patiriisocius marinistellae]GEQ87274.1 N-(5'-phosphoribosyl)anthranilate isomerase [Patiriisocius marinistellae]